MRSNSKFQLPSKKMLNVFQYFLLFFFGKKKFQILKRTDNFKQNQKLTKTCWSFRFYYIFYKTLNCIRGVFRSIKIVFFH